MTQRLAICLECDIVHRRRSLAAGEKAHCVNCGGVLYERPHLSPNHLLALVLTALMVFAIANVTPIVDLESQGVRNSASLLGSIVALWSEGRQPVALLVFATGLFFPLFDLLAMLLLLLCARRRRRPALFAPLLRVLQSLRPWGMIEVLLLGVIVALVKLSRLAEVTPGVALWAYGGLTILLAVILSFDLNSLWDSTDGGAEA